MKKYYFLFAFLLIGKFSFSQQTKKIIDYQYQRDGKSYFAFEIYKNLSDTNSDKLNLNFSSNSQYSKVEKVVVKIGDDETKLSFKFNDQQNISDNKEIKNYLITIDKKDLFKITACNATIIFKLDNGLIFSLPFSPCAYKSVLAQF